MSAIDLVYQNVVEGVANEVLQLPLTELSNYPDYGSVQRGTMSVAYWHYKFSDDNHQIVFISNRIVWPFPKLYRNYLAGVRFGTDGQPRRMTDDEVAAYD